MPRPGLNSSKLLVVLALICALAGSGFAHRVAEPSGEPALAAYVLAGGSLAELCGDVDGPRHDILQSCEACRLVNSAVLAEHDTVVASVVGKPSRLEVSGHQSAFTATRLDQSRLVRGPPAS